MKSNCIEPNAERIPNDRLSEACLYAVAAVSSLTEECRKQVIDLKILPCIVLSLSSSDIGVKVAACTCARSLSRSVKNLRTNLVDAGISNPVLDLLFENDDKVKKIASATLCNIVLDFSPMKKSVIERGGVQRLVVLMKSDDLELRLNSAWALKNMLYHADVDTKRQIMLHLGWDSLLKYLFLNSIIGDSNVSLRTQGLNILRNMVCPGENVINFDRRILTLLFTASAQRNYYMS